MLRATRWICGSLVLAGWLGTAALAPAQSKNDPPRKINDEAGLFSKDAIRKAETEIADIKRTYRKDVLIETREKGIRDADEARWKAWAEEQASEHRIQGVYIVITKEPRHFEVVPGKATLKSGDFTLADRNRVGDILKQELGKDRDKALLDAVRYIGSALRDNTAPKAGAAPAPAPAPAPGNGGQVHGEERRSGTGWLGLGGLGIGGIICIGLVVLAVIWVVIGLIRSMMAPRYPAAGPGGGYGGGYGPGYGGYGGGGGGFFSSLLGGMFGAAAGMWMYNSFFGGHSSAASPPTSTGFGGGGYYGGNAGTSDPEAQPNDVASGYSAGGGDWGEDKDNAGGGGDGGGGDAGGGGGGDWGGGGGDWGGGGGDGGGDGGGGGGDW